MEKNFDTNEALSKLVNGSTEKNLVGLFTQFTDVTTENAQEMEAELRAFVGEDTDRIDTVYGLIDAIERSNTGSMLQVFANVLMNGEERVVNQAKAYKKHYADIMKNRFVKKLMHKTKRAEENLARTQPEMPLAERHTLAVKIATFS